MLQLEKKRNYTPLFLTTAGAYGILFQETASFAWNPLMLYWLQERILCLTTSLPLPYRTCATWKVGKIQVLTECFNKVLMFFSVNVISWSSFSLITDWGLNVPWEYLSLTCPIVLPRCLFNPLQLTSSRVCPHPHQNSAYDGHQFPIPTHM